MHYPKVPAPNDAIVDINRLYEQAEYHELLKDMERERAKLRKSLNEAKEDLLSACQAMLDASVDSWHWEHTYHERYADYRKSNERYRKLLKQMAAKNKMIDKIRSELKND